MNKPTDTLGLYEITYPNGVRQEKYLIEQDLFDDWYQRKILCIGDKEGYDELKEEGITRFGKEPFYFTTKSPIMMDKENKIKFLTL